MTHSFHPQLNAINAATEAACLVLSVDETVKNPKVIRKFGLMTENLDDPVTIFTSVWLSLHDNDTCFCCSLRALKVMPLLWEEVEVEEEVATVVVEWGGDKRSNVLFSFRGILVCFQCILMNTCCYFFGLHFSTFAVCGFVNFELTDNLSLNFFVVF